MNLSTVDLTIITIIIAETWEHCMWRDEPNRCCTKQNKIPGFISVTIRIQLSISLRRISGYCSAFSFVQIVPFITNGDRADLILYIRSTKGNNAGCQKAHYVNSSQRTCTEYNLMRYYKKLAIQLTSRLASTAAARVAATVFWKIYTESREVLWYKNKFLKNFQLIFLHFHKFIILKFYKCERISLIFLHILLPLLTCLTTADFIILNA